MKISFVATAVGTRAGERVWDLDAFRTECRAADRAGFHFGYTGERRGRGPASGKTAVPYNPDLLCLHGLDVTEQLRFGSHITLLPLHHPLRVVQDACVVNAIHPGRFRLGVGAGYTVDDFAAFGVSLRERGRRMEIGLEAMRAFLERRPYELSGPWQGVIPDRDPAMGDQPLEIYMGAWSEPGVRRAARLADGWFTGPIRTVEAEAELADMYREQCAREGKTPHIVLMREAAIAGSDDEARERFGPHLLDYARIYYERGGTYEERFDPWLGKVESAADMTLDMVLPDRFLCGGVDTWLETLATWKRTIDPDEVLVRLRYYYGPPLDDALEAMDLIGREIIPVVDSPSRSAS